MWRYRTRYCKYLNVGPSSRLSQRSLLPICSQRYDKCQSEYLKLSWKDFIALPLQLEPCPQQGLSEGRHLQQHPMNSDIPASHKTERRNKHPHKCSYCGKAFKQKSGLHKHLRVHTGERPFCCHLCPMTFTQREAVVRHVRTHTGERPFHCPFCLKSYRDSTNLRRHKATHAWQFTSNVSFSAGSSNEALTCVSLLGTKWPDMSIVVFLFCNVLEQRLKTKNRQTEVEWKGRWSFEPDCGLLALCTGLIFHSDLIAKPVQLEPFTQRGLNEGRHLLQHVVYDDVATHHVSKRLRKCSYCGKAFKRKLDLEKHMRVHTGEKPFCCHLCPMTFTQKQSVSRHMRTHTGEKPYHCRFCPKACSDESNLKRHEATHTRQVTPNVSPNVGCLSLSCADLIATPVQLELFTQRGLNEGRHLLQHVVYDDVATHHVSKRPCKCSYCGKGFKRKFDLDKHMRVHTGEKPYCCHLCPMTFTQKQSVSRHMRTHTGEKPYHCRFCPKACAAESNLRTHEATHTRQVTPNVSLNTGSSWRNSCNLAAEPVQLELSSQQSLNKGRHLPQRLVCSVVKSSHISKQPRKCSYCGKVFKQKFDLDKHVRVHTGEKPFRCHLCPMAFTQKQSVLRHIRTHTGEKPYHCRFCPMSCADESNLKRHEATHTRQVTPNVSPDVGSPCIKADAPPKENEMLEDYVRGTDDNLLSANVCKQACSARLLQHSADQLGDGASTRQVGLHCSLFPTSGSDLSYHESVHGNERFTCGYCKKVFKKRGALTVHLRIHTGEKPYQCHLCPRNFTQRATLMYHMRTHTGEKPYQCRYCPRAFSRKMLQKNHERRKHLEHLTTYTVAMSRYPEASPQLCSNMERHLLRHTVCGYATASRNTMEIHQREHNENFLNKCDYCGKVFPLRLQPWDSEPTCSLVQKTAGSMFCSGRVAFFCADIQAVHYQPGPSPLRCSNMERRLVRHPVSSYVTTSHKRMENLRRARYRQRSHQCDYCNKLFFQKSNLDDHLRIHTGEKPFRCHLCPMSFTQKSGMVRHTQTHTGVKPYQCSFCPLTFTRKPHRQKHMEKVHMWQGMDTS
ncbi:uncharacterized protein LOC142558444 [Dermacentor variabilis]|uniref:uncharacterized protein LOC142558444 n=1 Tax=Dermacentor variabilis TaxID=34621 RepID=UPI003F5B0341